MGSTGSGEDFGKRARNCMKMTKAAFLAQNSRKNMGGQANVLGSGGILPQSTLLGKILIFLQCLNALL